MESQNLWRLRMQLVAVLPLATLAVMALMIHSADAADVPGVIINASTEYGTYTSSPAITVLSNGDYLVSHDLFGSGTSTAAGTSKVFLSTDKGATWTAQATLTGIGAASLFTINDAVYMFGESNGNGVIRKSTDNGATWTTPTNSANGLIGIGRAPGTPCSPVVYNDRIWAAQSRSVWSAPVGADLLSASSWTLSNEISPDTNWLNGTFTFWTETQIVASPQTGVVLMPKTNQLPYTGLIKVTNPNIIRFNEATDFVALPGAEKKFGAQYDPVSKKFYILDNPVLPAYANESASLTRNTAAILSSKDLYHWDVEKLFLFTPTVAEAFQYLNFDIDGDDLVVASRTGFPYNGIAYSRGHDSNLVTFHKISDFRTAAPEQVLTVDMTNDQVLRSETTQYQSAPLGKFTLGAKFSGTALTKPIGVAQTENGDVYIKEQGGRILQFDSLGNFINVVSTAPSLTFTTSLSVKQPSAGERSWIASGSADWAEPTNWYYWGTADTNYEVATFGSAATADSTISVNGSYTIKGMRFRNVSKYTVSGTGSLTIAAESGNGVLEVSQGSHNLQVACKIASNTDLTTQNGAAIQFQKKLDLNGQKLTVLGDGKAFIDDEFVMNGGSLVVDGLTALTFSSSSTPTLDGILQFIPDSSLSLTPDSYFTLFDGADWLGDAVFSSLLLPTLAEPDWKWDTSRLYSDGIVSIATTVPEPGTIGMLTAAVLGLAACAWRKRRTL